MKLQKKQEKLYNRNMVSGITLIALVVTIVVLLILAGITISTLFGENGIITAARKAADDTKQDEINTEREIKDLKDQMNEYLNPPVDVSTLTTEFVKANSKAFDEYGNNLIIPQGFKVAMPNSTNKITYTNNKPHVTDGIVIEDIDGNQFVWVPVSKNENDKIKSTTKETTIILARYTFTSDGTPSKPITDGEVEINSDDSGGFTHKESTISTEYNTAAISLNDFLNNSRKNGGYYIGRYEASYRSGSHKEDYIAYCKPSTSFRDNYTTSLASGMIWNDVSQPDAVYACRNMYKNNESITSDLVNSFTWDTAIVFIQEFSGESDYSKKNGASINRNLTNTGSNNDKVCNIYDMAGNTCEWSTEATSYGGPATVRGGSYSYEGHRNRMY